MRRYVRLLAVLPLLLVAGPAAAGVPDQWGQAAAHAGGDRHNPGESRLTPAAAARLKPAWSIPAPAVACADPSGPLIGREHLVVAAGYRVSAYDPSTGKPRWRTPEAAKRDIRLLAVEGDRVLAQYRDCRTGKAFLTALDARNGRTVYTKPLTAIMFTPLVDKGVLVGGLWDPAINAYGLRAYRIKDGSALWARTGSFSGQGVSAGGRILAGDVALDIKTGKPAWRLDGRCNDPLGAAGPAVYCSGEDGIYVLNAADGKPRAMWPGDYFGFATDGKRIYTRQHSSAVALSTADGHRLWTVPFPADAPIAYSVAGGVAYGWRGNGHPVAAFNATTGKPIDLDPRTATLREPLMIAHGHLYAATPTGVAAFAP